MGVIAIDNKTKRSSLFILLDHPAFGMKKLIAVAASCMGLSEHRSTGGTKLGVRRTSSAVARRIVSLGFLSWCATGPSGMPDSNRNFCFDGVGDVTLFVRKVVKPLLVRWRGQ